jgi:hypothetical protein
MDGADVELALMTHGIPQREALLSRCHHFHLSHILFAAKKNCQSEGVSRKL